MGYYIYVLTDAPYINVAVNLFGVTVLLLKSLKLKDPLTIHSSYTCLACRLSLLSPNM